MIINIPFVIPDSMSGAENGLVSCTFFVGWGLQANADVRSRRRFTCVNLAQPKSQTLQSHAAACRKERLSARGCGWHPRLAAGRRQRWDSFSVTAHIKGTGRNVWSPWKTHLSKSPRSWQPGFIQKVFPIQLCAVVLTWDVFCCPFKASHERMPPVSHLSWSWMSQTAQLIAAM